jgi:hypothetical protein
MIVYTGNMTKTSETVISFAVLTAVLAVAVPFSGTYSTRTATGYVISSLLVSLADDPAPSNASEGYLERRKWAQDLLPQLRNRQNQTGLIDVSGLSPNSLKFLAEGGFLVKREVMLSPKRFSLTGEVPIVLVPAFRNPVILGQVGLMIILLSYTLKELAKARRGNAIVLTLASFNENRTGLFVSRKITIPWRDVQGTEKTVRYSGISIPALSALLGTDKKLVIEDRRSRKTYGYRPRSIRHYNELRVALITRVGLTEESEEWREQ